MRQNRLIPSAGKRRNAGKIRTSALPINESVWLTLDSGRITRVQIGCVYLVLSERIEARVSWRKYCRREPYESRKDGRPEKYHRRKRVVNYVTKKWE
jgi:hypothetical protein